MSRRADPLKALKAHNDKLDEMRDSRKVLEEEASRFTGALALEAGLSTWDAKSLRAGFKRLAKLGEAWALEKTEPQAAPSSKARPRAADAIAAE